MSTENGKSFQNFSAAVLFLCVTGLMTWLSWLTIVVFNHTKDMVELSKDYSFIQKEIERLHKDQ